MARSRWSELTTGSVHKRCPTWSSPSRIMTTANGNSRNCRDSHNRGRSYVGVTRAAAGWMCRRSSWRLILLMTMVAQLIAVSEQEEQKKNTHADFCAGLTKEIDGKLLGAYSWVVRKPTKQGEVNLLYLSLCEPLNFNRKDSDSSKLHPIECNGALACHVSQFSGNQSYNAQILVKANETHQPFEVRRDYLFLTGGSCPTALHKETKVLISFQCGTHLGSPQYMLDVFCQTVLRWRTSAACIESPSGGTSPATTVLPPSTPIVKPRVQVPCYVFDEFTGDKYDLSHLTRLRGAHKVAARVELYINICQDITDNLIGCTTPGTAACLNLSKSSWKSVGLISSSTRVQLIKETGDLIITYKPSKNSKPFQNCTNDPSTVIHFRCPEKRGRNRPPRLLADISCQYMIEWETDHACPEQSIVGDANNCKLDIGGNKLDLARLRNPKGIHRVPNVPIFNEKHDIVIDICNHGLGDGGACGKMAGTVTGNVCYNDSNGNAFILGSKADAHLRYTDGRATLVYFDGSPCSNGPDSNRKWSSVIEFVCDSEATFGAPELVNVDTDVCIIRFEWKTVSACIPDVLTGDEDADYSELQESCVYTNGDFRMDLSALYLETGSWFVADDGERFEYNVYADVCSPVRPLGHLANCPVGSAVCGLARDNSTVISFGRYQTVRLLQNTSLPVGALEFSDGDECKSRPGKRYKTLIHLACTPGVHGASPRYFAFDKTNCELHLEWHTSVACPQVSLKNTTCMVEDKTHGFLIDLRPLAKAGVQTINWGGFEYDVAVCNALPNAHACGDNQNAAVCRRNLTDNREPTPLGTASSTLIYNGGLITVVYVGDKGESSNIAFHCDFDAGIGKPQVLTTQPGMTVFNWATSFACPPMNAHYQSCVVQANDKSGHIFDLSRLSRVRPNRDWVFLTIDPKDPSIRLRFYVSLCRPLRKPPARCNPLAAVCVETIYPNGTSTFADAGHAVDPPTSADDRGQLMLNYSNGGYCKLRGVNATMRTLIHFQCDDEIEANGEYLQYMGKLDECGYSLLWTTEAACPIRHHPVRDECAVVDRLTGDIFNITHMRADTFYTSGEYEFNICGPIKNSTHCTGDNVSVCHITTDNAGRTIGVPLTGATGYQLDFVGVDSLRLSYMGEIASGRTTRVEIELVCTTVQSMKKNVIEARGPLGDDQVHRINFYSSGVCPHYRNDPTSCEIINSKTGHVYDLRPLAHTALSNWEAQEYSPLSYDYHTSPEQKYHFNVCKKLNTVPEVDGGYNCPKGSYACATYTNDTERTGESLGRHMEDIVFGEDGTIGIRYVGGDKCPPQKNRDGSRQGGNGTQGETNPRFKSSLITLVCTPNAHETPKIIKNTRDCEYVFYMETPAACPVKKVMGSDCKVAEPNFGYQFDLSALGGKNKVYTVSNPYDKGMHKMSVCGPLPDAGALCGGDKEAGSCLIGTDGKNISLGKGTSTLQYDTGILTLVYNNGVPGCHKSKENRSTTINFFCDHSAKVGSTAPEFQSMDDKCGFVFSWYTELACPPRTEQICKVETPDGTVDLTPLSAPRWNYVTPDSLTEVGQKYVVNVCRSVVHMRALTCGFSSGACVINGDKTLNLGVVSRGPFYVKDERAVRIRYQDGDPCTDGGTPGSSNRWSTLIDFICHNEDSGPVHIMNENCEALFIWNTPHACPQSRDPPLPAKNLTCTAVHPSSGHPVIDLYSLVRGDNESPYAVPGPAGGTFKLNICGSAKETSCGPDTGICLENRHEVHKIAPPSSRLVWDDGVLAMIFEGGDRCGLTNENDSRTMRAIIHFVCPSAGFGRDAPQFVSQSPDDCEYRFVWPTELACQNVLQCAHYEDQELFDLSPLSTRSHRAHNILDTGYEYYLSVCRPLEPHRPYLSMPPNAAIVRVAVNSKQVESLGRTFLEPFTDFQHSVTLLYVNGSRCEWDNAQLYKARISFECDYSQDAGEPVLVDIDQADCLHVFRWRTNLVCAGSADTHQINPRGNCSFPVLQRGITLDLAPLAKKSPYQVRVNSPDGGDSGYFTMSVCKDISESASGCRNSELCLTSKEGESVRNISYGVAESYHYQGGSLFVRYTTGDKCVSMLGKTYGAIVEFECDPLYDTGIPVVERQYGCMTVFRWKTVKACSPQQLQAAEGHDCIARRGSSVFDLTMLSSVSHAWKLEDPQSGSTFYLNICGMSHKWPLEAIDKCSKSGICVEKKTLDNKSEFASLGEYTSRKMEVEDSSTVRITYEGGDPSVCPRPGQHPKTIISIKCSLDGSSIGSPRLVSGPTSKSCTHKFEWPTRYACPEATDVLVVQKGGYLIDPVMHRAYNLTALFNRTFRTLEYRHGQDNYTYLVNLREVCTDSSCRIPWRMGPCAQSAVCQAKRSTFMKNIGSANKQRFYARGSELLLVIDTLSTCLHVPNATIKSIFSFACNPDAGFGVPSFLYETKSCHYIFSWPTEYVCPSRVEHPAMAWSHMGPGGASGGTSAVSVVVMLSAVAITLAGLFMFLSKPDNRMAVRARTLRIFRTVTMPHYYYSKTESEMQSPLDNDGDTVLLSPSLVLQPDDDDFSSPLA